MGEFPKQVRTSIQPDVVLEVEENEYLDLSRQGLLISEGYTGPVPENRKTAVADSDEKGGK